MIRIDPRDPPGDGHRSRREQPRRRSPSPAARCGRRRSRPRASAPRRHAARQLARFAPARLDPVGYDRRTTGRCCSLAYDGLVAYRRAGGRRAARSSPTSPASCREPSPDGRTYLFRLRPDCASPTARRSGPRTSARRSSACSCCVRDLDCSFDLPARFAEPGACQRRTLRSLGGHRDRRRGPDHHLPSEPARRRLPARAPRRARRAGRQPGER